MKNPFNRDGALTRRSLLLAFGALALGQTAHAQTSIAPQNRLNQLNSLQEIMATLPGTDPVADANTMLSAIRSRPVFVASGVRGATVWARWKDGPMVAFNVVPTVTLAPEATPTAPTITSELKETTSPASSESQVTHKPWTEAQAEAATTEPMLNMPNQSVARVLCSFPDTQKYADKIATTLTGARFNYSVSSRDASVGALRSVTGDGLFYIDAHAGTVEINGRDVCYVQTSTDVTLNSLGKPVMDADLKTLRLVPMCTIEKIVDADGKVVEKEIYTKYGFGPRWISYYNWRFSKNSLVFVNACYAANAPLRDAFFAAGASAYMGWTKSVRNMRAVDAGHYLIDRLLGANELRGMSGSFPPEFTKQRAFNVDSLLAKMKQIGLAQDKTTDGDAELTIERRALNGRFGLLAPSIRRMRVREDANEIIFTGLFGPDQGENGFVEIEGTNLKVRSWEPTKVTCTLPPHGAGSSGLAQVTVKNHKSNIVPLTEWTGTINYELKSIGTLKQVFSYPVRFRHDVHLYRDVPGERPHGTTDPVGQTFQATRFARNGTELRGTFNCSGTGSPPDEHCPTIMTWNGSGSTMNALFAPTDQFVPQYTCFGRIDADKKEMLMYNLSQALITVTFAEGAPCDSEPFSSPAGAATYYNLDQPEQYITAGTGYNFPALTFSDTHTTPYAGQFPLSTYTWRWSAFTSLTPPVSPMPDGWGA